MNRLLWGRAARRDLARLAAFYNHLQPGMGDELRLRAEDLPNILLEYPQIGSPTSRRGIRKWNAKRTPFQIYYAIVGDDIQIRRVAHNRIAP